MDHADPAPKVRRGPREPDNPRSHRGPVGIPWVTSVERDIAPLRGHGFERQPVAHRHAEVAGELLAQHDFVATARVRRPSGDDHRAVQCGDVAHSQRRAREEVVVRVEIPRPFGRTKSSTSLDVDTTPWIAAMRRSRSPSSARSPMTATSAAPVSERSREKAVSDRDAASSVARTPPTTIATTAARPRYVRHRLRHSAHAKKVPGPVTLPSKSLGRGPAMGRARRVRWC